MSNQDIALQPRPATGDSTFDSAAIERRILAKALDAASDPQAWRLVIEDLVALSGGIGGA
jgi:hypothetical protein